LKDVAGGCWTVYGRGAGRRDGSSPGKRRSWGSGGIVLEQFVSVLREVVWVVCAGRSRLSPAFPGETGLPAFRRTCHDAGMAKINRLRASYRFPGFTPQPKVRVIFGAPWAGVIPLRRRRKTRSGASADKLPARTTTSGPAASATWPVATSGSISTSRF